MSVRRTVKPPVSAEESSETRIEVAPDSRLYVRWGMQARHDCPGAPIKLFYPYRTSPACNWISP